MENTQVSQGAVKAARATIRERLDELTRIMHWIGVTADYAVKARLVDDGLLEEPELRSNQVGKVLQAYTQEVPVIMTEICDIKHFMFPEGMNFAELSTLSGLRELGGP